MNKVEKKSEVINPHQEHRNMKSTHVETRNHSQQQHQAHHDPATHQIMMIADFKRRFIVSLIFTIPILLLSPIIQEWLGFNLSFAGSNYLLFLLSTFVFFYGGWPFLKGIIQELKSKILGMMTLIAVAISVAYFYSTSVVFGLEGEVFFWELATLIDIMLLGHWIEMKSVLGASNALEKLAQLMPDTAHIIKGNEMGGEKSSEPLIYKNCRTDIG